MGYDKLRMNEKRNVFCGTRAFSIDRSWDCREGKGRRKGVELKIKGFMVGDFSNILLARQLITDSWSQQPQR